MIVASIAGVGVLALAVAYFATPWFRSAGIQSVAVLPFVNATGDPELEYLSDGVTESLINALGQLPDLSVKARSMVFRYKGKEADPQEVASALSVDAVVNGRIERRGDRLMLSLALAKGADGDHLWGERYDSTMTDLVAVQSGMARDIAGTPAYAPVRRGRAADSAVVHRERRGLPALPQGPLSRQKVALPEIQTGIQFLEQATAIDPNYALAYVGLADAYRTASAADVTPSQVVPKAKAAAERAVQIDRRPLVGPRAARHPRDLVRLRSASRRAALQARAGARPGQRGGAYLLRAPALEPGPPRGSDPGGRARPRAGAVQLAIQCPDGTIPGACPPPRRCDRPAPATIALDPNHVLARLFIATAYVEQEMYAEAIAEAQVAVDRTRRRLTHPLGVLGYALAKSGNVAQARAVLDELVTASRSRYVSPYGVALVFNALGERDETFAWLERGFEVDDHKMNLLKVDPKWNNLHGDPRFEDLVKRIGF